MNNIKSPRERFLKVAENRTNNAIKAIKVLGQCSNPRNYEYTQDELMQMLNAVKNELKKTEDLFKNNGKKYISFQLEE
jgi:hypothetical protein